MVMCYYSLIYYLSRNKQLKSLRRGLGGLLTSDPDAIVNPKTGETWGGLVHDLVDKNVKGPALARKLSSFGDFVYTDFTNSAVGVVSTIEVVPLGSVTINEGAIEVTVEVEGEDLADKTPVAFSTNASISFTNDVRDITNKDSAGYQEIASGLRSFEISTDALQDYTSDLDFKDFFDNIGNRESVIIRFAERDTGGSSDLYYEGNAFITSLSMDAGVEDNATYSVTFTGTAAVTSGTD